MARQTGTKNKVVPTLEHKTFGSVSVIGASANDNGEPLLECNLESGTKKLLLALPDYWNATAEELQQLWKRLYKSKTVLARRARELRGQRQEEIDRAFGEDVETEEEPEACLLSGPGTVL